MTNSLLSFLSDINALQNTDRTGYKELGIPNPESVAEHSYSVIWFAMIIAEAEGADIDKVLKMALLHDLPEARTGDFTQPFVEKYFGEAQKKQMEAEVLQDQLQQLPESLRQLLGTLWTELNDNLSLESNIVHDADKLQMMHRIALYENTYTTDFSAFWRYADQREWLPASAELYHALRTRGSK